MSGRPRKRSLTIAGHRTSVSLEDAFWEAFAAIAAERGETLNGLATRIDAGRGPDVGLASAIRIFVLGRYREPLRNGRDAPEDGAQESSMKDEPERF